MYICFSQELKMRLTPVPRSQQFSEYCVDSRPTWITCALIPPCTRTHECDSTATRLQQSTEHKYTRRRHILSTTMFGLWSLVFVSHSWHSKIQPANRMKSKQEKSTIASRPYALSLMKISLVIMVSENTHATCCSLHIIADESEHRLCFINSKPNKLNQMCIRMSNSVGKQFNVECCAVALRSKYEWQW